MLQWGGGKGPGHSRKGGGGGGGGSEVTFPDGQVAVQISFKIVSYLLWKSFTDKNISLGFGYTIMLHFKQVFFLLRAH